MKLNNRATFLATVFAAAGLSAGAANAATATLVGDKIVGYEIFPERTASTPVASTANAVTVTDDATDSFGFGFGDRISVDVNAMSVTLTYIFGSTTPYPGGSDCNCLLLAGLNFSDGSTISALTIDSASGGFSAFSLAADADFGTNALANFAFPAGPVAIPLIESDAENGEFALIDVGGLTLSQNDSLTLGFTTTSAVTPPVAPIPLPAAAWMLLAGLAGLGAMARKRG